MQFMFQQSAGCENARVVLDHTKAKAGMQDNIRGLATVKRVGNETSRSSPRSTSASFPMLIPLLSNIFTGDKKSVEGVEYKQSRQTQHLQSTRRVQQPRQMRRNNVQYFRTLHTWRFMRVRAM
jgi:hypothetical protein